MLFNSLSFAAFLPVVFILYWMFRGNLKNQNRLLLLSSYFFYGCWDWRFLFLLFFSTFLDYYTGIRITRAKSRQSEKFWFWLSISVNLGFLGVFKYYNFFAASFAGLLSSVGFQANFWTLKVILPVGISFYTFHGLSYVIDIYKKRIEPELNFTDYAVFVSFFPLLVAGPIERATHLLPQIKKKRTFNYETAVDGLRQILWGLFKKVVVADSCAVYANTIFNDSGSYSGSTLLLGAVFFSIQIYGDFSGYSDIALGTARLFGIDLLRNFAYPYFSRDIAEFWRRWHISLSTWFRDYLYVPLGGSQGGNLMRIRNTFIIFIVSGFWHGANWTFIIWGLLNAIYIMPSIVFKTNRKNLDIVAQHSVFPNIRETISMAVTFFLTVMAWIFFRSESVQQAFQYIGTIFSGTLFKIPYFPGIGRSFPVLVFIFIFFATEWFGRKDQFALQTAWLKFPAAIRWSFYGVLVFAIYYFSVTVSTQQFIYFQF